MQAVISGDLLLIVSDRGLRELVEVSTRVELVRKLGITDRRRMRFIRILHERCERHLDVPPACDECRDADDNHYLDLVIHTRADGLVTSDRDLLSLQTSAAGDSVRAKYPAFRVFTPVQLLMEIFPSDETGFSRY
jgi:putative PIN family toxin of toxin-antitoxin system